MPPENDNIDTSGMDIGAIADSIGNEIFGAGDPASPGSQAAAPPPPAPPQQPETPDEWAAMPKAWKKEKEPLWAKLDREAREYIYARENDVVKGFEQYATGHKNWNELTSPFQNVLTQHPNVNPVQVMQNLLRNHLTLLQATPEQKKVMAQQLLKHYGVDIGPAAGNPPTTGNPPALPPEVSQALGTVTQLRDELGRFKANEERRQLEENTKAVQAFAADPANKYFEEVQDDILEILQTQVKPDLKKAYETAIWTNPVVRQKLLAEQKAASAPPPKPPLNVNGSGGTPPEKPKTYEDSIDAVMTKNYGPNWKTAH